MKTLQATRYRIAVAGQVGQRFWDFVDATVVDEQPGRTTIETEVRDAAELVGVLTRLCDLGLMPLETVATDSLANRLRVDPTPRRIRALVDGVPVVDSRAAALVYESGTHPTYAFPAGDIAWDAFEPSGSTAVHPAKGNARYWNLETGERRVGDALVGWDGNTLSGLVSLEWDAIDVWLEEDEQVFFHPRDPFRRVDVIESSRHVRYELDGTVLAETHRPRLVAETGLPERWYVPVGDLQHARLTPTSTTTGCQYKGLASYWSAVVDGQTLDDLVWSYVRPTPEAGKLAGLACLPAERVDCSVDGVLQPKPVFDPSWLNPSIP